MSTNVTINTPGSLTTCVAAQIPISGGTPPYQLEVLDSSDLNAGPILVLGPINKAGSFSWPVNVTAGTTVVFEALDSAGNSGYSSALKISAGTNTSCIQSASTPTASSLRKVAKTSISTGAIIGIAVGVVIVFLVIIITLFLVRRRDRRNSTYHGPRRPESVAAPYSSHQQQIPQRPSVYYGQTGSTEKYSLSNMGSTYQFSKH